jgi:hypothetical protein
MRFHACPPFAGLREDVACFAAGELNRGEGLWAPPDPRRPVTARAKVLDPLRVTVWDDQVFGAVVGQHVDPDLPPFPGP